MASISVRCDGDAEDGWQCAVTVGEGGIDISTHRVRVWAADLAHFAPDASTPDELVKASFVFLLERESPEMILRAFDLTDVARYFPEYESEFPARHG